MSVFASCMLMACSEDEIGDQRIAVGLDALKNLDSQEFEVIKYIEENAVILTDFGKVDDPSFYTTSKSGYVRYYTIEQDMVTGHYQRGYGKKNGIIIGPPNTFILDGGCSAITVKFDRRKKTFMVAAFPDSGRIEFHGECNGIA